MATPTPKKKPAARKQPGAVLARLDARPDTLDFRDKMYVPTLIEVPTQVALEEYTAFQVPVLNQGTEGACTGFGLATVANYLLLRRRVLPDPVPVSARMFYEMARRYDEWPGEDYSGSSARGAMKGWHKHGVCAWDDWPYKLPPKSRQGLTEDRTASALKRPLGAYFRVNHQDLVAMHTAIAEVGVLYATATVHQGWGDVADDGSITQSDKILGGHAFAIVAYDADGFWIQNSWGTGWGRKGLGHVSYDDWLANGTDAWVARLGAPVRLQRRTSTATLHAPSSGQSAAYAYADIRPHIVSIGNDGTLQAGGDYGSTPAELAQIFADDIPKAMDAWPVKRLLLYAHGGLVGEAPAVQRLAEYRPALLKAGVYPLAFVWHSDYWTTITNIIQDAIRRRRPEGLLDAAKDFLLDRLDDALEPLARQLSGKASWDEMKENALAASGSRGGARLVLEHVAELAKRTPGLEVHVVGHSAGAIFHAPLLQLLTTTGKLASGPQKAATGYGIPVASCTLWAPACTVDLFKETYLPAIASGAIRRFALFALSDQAEQDDNCAGIYHKSLLYLVSNAFEQRPRLPGLLPGARQQGGWPILGMEKFIAADPELAALFKSAKAELVIAPNTLPLGDTAASQARHHGDFDDDQATVAATFARIVGTGPSGSSAKGARSAAPAAVARMAGMAAGIEFHASQSSLRERRLRIQGKTQSGL